MSSIKDYIDHWKRSASYDKNLDQLLRSFGAEVRDIFDLAESDISYWIEYADSYSEAPEMVDDATELQGSIEDMSIFVIQKWELFPESVHEELKGILEFVLHLRISSLNKARYTAGSQDVVRDNIYEM